MTDNNVFLASESNAYPLYYSLRGDNTQYVGCEYRGCRQNYAICCNILKAKEEGRRNSEAECSREIDKGLCKAAEMRKEEIKAGYTLYYIPRVVKKAEIASVDAPENRPKGVENTEGYKRGWDSAGEIITGKSAPARSQPKRVMQKPKPRPTLKSEPADEANGFAKAINMAIKESAQKSVETKAKEKVTLETAKSPVKKESALERMRRIKAERENLT